MSASIDECTVKKQLPPTHLIFFVLFLSEKKEEKKRSSPGHSIWHETDTPISKKHSKEYASTLPASEPIPWSEAGKSH